MLDRVVLPPGEALAAGEVVGAAVVVGVGLDERAAALDALVVAAGLVEVLKRPPDVPAPGVKTCPGRPPIATIVVPGS
jgi:hypothetical protein